MNVFLTYHKIDAGHGKNDAEQNYRRRRGKGGISAAVTVKHIVNVANDGIHTCHVKISSKEGNRIAIGLERADKSSNNDIENSGRYGGQSDPCKHSVLGSAVHPCRIVIHLWHRADSACKHEHLKGHNDPDGIEAKHKHLGPIRTVNKIYGREAEDRKKAVYKSVVIQGRLKEYHKHQADRQGVGYVRQEEYRLEKVTQLFYRAEGDGYQQRKDGGHWHGDEYQDHGVFHSLQEIRIAQNVAVIVEAYAEITAGNEVVSLLKGIDENVY